MDPLVIAQIIIAAAQDALFALAAGALACSAMLGRQGRVPLANLGCWRLAAVCGLAFGCGLYLWLQAAVTCSAV